MGTKTIIDRATIKLIADELEAAVQTVAEKHGIQITSGRQQYGHTRGTIKMELATINEDGEAQTPERTALDMLGALDGIKHGMTFTNRGRTFTVTGYNSRARKRPYICERDDGGSYVFPAESLKALLKLNA
jgi:hypothetical protein